MVNYHWLGKGSSGLLFFVCICVPSQLELGLVVFFCVALLLARFTFLFILKGNASLFKVNIMKVMDASPSVESLTCRSFRKKKP